MPSMPCEKVSPHEMQNYILEAWEFVLAAGFNRVLASAESTGSEELDYNKEL